MTTLSMTYNTALGTPHHPPTFAGLIIEDERAFVTLF